jgi:hypothetical protein
MAQMNSSRFGGERARGLLGGPGGVAECDGPGLAGDGHRSPMEESRSACQHATEEQAQRGSTGHGTTKSSGERIETQIVQGRPPRCSSSGVAMDKVILGRVPR